MIASHAPVADWSAYDFIDLASSKGGSIRHCAKRFNARGIGIERDPERVDEARRAGLEVVRGDAALLDCEKAVRFVSMMNFLEHLPDLRAVEDTLARAKRAARDFLFIRHPSFEGEDDARQKGYIIGHWREGGGHTSHVKLADFTAMFARLGVGPVVTHSVEPIRHTSHEMIVGLDGERPNLDIDPPLWRRHDMFVQLRPIKARYWDKITSPLPKEIAKGVHTCAGNNGPVRRDWAPV